MPHDKNGILLNVGDEVILRGRVTAVSEGETQCNVTVEAVERPEGEDYIPSIAGNSRFYERDMTVLEPEQPAAPLAEPNQAGRWTVKDSRGVTHNAKVVADSNRGFLVLLESGQSLMPLSHFTGHHDWRLVD